MNQDGGRKFPRKVHRIDPKFGYSISSGPVMAPVISPVQVVSPVFTPQYDLLPPALGLIKPVKYPLISAYRQFLPLNIYDRKFGVLVVLKTDSPKLNPKPKADSPVTDFNVRKIIANKKKELDKLKSTEDIKKLENEIKDLENTFIVNPAFREMTSSLLGGTGETYEILFRKSSFSIELFTGTETTMHPHILSYTNQVLDVQKIAPTTVNKVIYDNAIIYVIVLNKDTIPSALLDKIKVKSTLVNLEELLKLDSNSRFVTNTEGKIFSIRKRLISFIKDKKDEIKKMTNAQMKEEDGRLILTSE